MSTNYLIIMNKIITQTKFLSQQDKLFSLFVSQIGSLNIHYVAVAA